MKEARIHLLGLFVLSLLGLSLALIASRPGSDAAANPPQKPRLVVLVVIDQFRGDYLQRWGDLFEKGGFERLMSEGAWFQNCHYPYANTMTGPGHATLATGCWPATHGIVANDWYERRAGKVYCASLPRYEQVPPASDKKKDEKAGAAPGRLLAPTVADALKEATKGKARVVALSLKDRSSVLPGGRNPDVCYWVDNEGRFVTSTYYRDSPHSWVTDLNRSGIPDRWHGRSWERLRDNVDYVKRAGIDDGPGEGKGSKQGRTFPHPFDGGPKRLKKDYHAAVANSPFGNELLLEATRRAIDAEHLGMRDTPDLLSVSFSSNDLVGHTWGPDSQEVLDTTLRTDLIIKELLKLLDEKVGKGSWTLVLSADHGICPLPEASRVAGRYAQRIDPGPLFKNAEAYLDKMFGEVKRKKDGTGGWIESNLSNMVYFNRKLLSARKVKQADAETVLARWFVEQPGIQAAYTRTQLLAGDFGLDAIGKQVRASFRPERSGDVMLVVKPYCLLTKELTGTTHGSPHEYDTHVPLVVYGPGVKAGIRRDRVSPEAAAVILASALAIDPPAQARVVVPEGLFAIHRK
jgi:predicted AlkP superfamily pyrophosphatase or phosphodiesterase